jgi:hypothetical protein
MMTRDTAPNTCAVWRAMVAALLMVAASASVIVAQATAGNLSLGAFYDVPSAAAVERPAGIRDVALGADRTTFVLDHRSRQLLAFDSAGRVLARRSLESDDVTGYLIAAQAHEVAVYDAVKSRLVRYELRGNRFADEGSFAVMPETAKAMCMMGDTIYVLAHHGDQILQLYSRDGRHVRSFGVAPGSSLSVQRAIVGAGAQLACSSESSLVVVAFAAWPQVMAFQGNGVKKWEYSIQNFHGILIKTLGDGTVEFSAPNGPLDAVASLLELGQGSVAVQILRRTNAARTAEPETIVLRLADGRSQGQTTIVPLMRHATPSGMLTVPPDAPLRVRVYPFRFSGR